MKWMRLLPIAAVLLGFAGPVRGELLPANIVNVALPEFGDHVGSGWDYGLANKIPVEIHRGTGSAGEIRVVQTPREMRLSRAREAHFSVTLGDVRELYFWMQAPRVHGQWHLTLTTKYPDGFEKVIFSRNIQNQVIHFTWVDPGTVLKVKMSSIEQTFKLSKRFLFTVSPARFTTWPDLRPVPYRNQWD